MSLRSTIETALRGHLQKQQRIKLQQKCMSWAFSEENIDSLKAYVRSQQLDVDLRDLQHELRTDGEFLLGGKVYAYSLAQDKPLSADQCQIDSAEARTIQETVESSTVLQRMFRAYRKQGFRCLSPKHIERILSEVLCNTDFDDYLGKFVNRKLMFLQRSYGVKADDLVSDMKQFSLYAVLRQYPKWHNFGHVQAVAKTAAKNRGKNIIQEYTADSRQALLKTENGDYQARCVSWTDFEETGTAGFSDPLSVDMTGHRENMFEYEVKLSLHELMDCSWIKPKQKRFLKLMLGEHDQGFSDFLDLPNEDLAEKDFDRYMSKVCSYINVRPEVAKEFLRSLKPYLA
jgi:hypothetical protein